MMIWERYLLRQFLKVFVLFLSCFYGLYILVDYASRASMLSFRHLQLSWGDLARYYGFVFASRAELLLPVALLIAFVHTLCRLNSRQELTALRAGGFGLKYLMRPFLVMGLFCVLLIYANEQFFLPQALRRLQEVEGSSKHRSQQGTGVVSAQHLFLRDGSLLIFQSCDAVRGRFFDVYWVQSVDSIYRMRELSLSAAAPVGHFVDHLVRQPNGELLQESAYRQLPLPLIPFDFEDLYPGALESESFSLSELLERCWADLGSPPRNRGTSLWTVLYWKLAIPWLCLLAIVAPAPFCVRFSRQIPLFLLYAGTLFGLIAFYMAMDALQIMGKRQLLPPLWAICGPFFIAFAHFGWRFGRMA